MANLDRPFSETEKVGPTYDWASALRSPRSDCRPTIQPWTLTTFPTRLIYSQKSSKPAPFRTPPCLISSTTSALSLNGSRSLVRLEGRRRNAGSPSIKYEQITLRPRALLRQDRQLRPSSLRRNLFTARLDHLRRLRQPQVAVTSSHGRKAFHMRRIPLQARHTLCNLRTKPSRSVGGLPMRRWSCVSRRPKSAERYMCPHGRGSVLRRLEMPLQRHQKAPEQRRRRRR